MADHTLSIHCCYYATKIWCEGQSALHKHTC